MLAVTLTCELKLDVDGETTQKLIQDGIQALEADDDVNCKRCKLSQACRSHCCGVQGMLLSLLSGTLMHSGSQKFGLRGLQCQGSGTM